MHLSRLNFDLSPPTKPTEAKPPVTQPVPQAAFSELPEPMGGHRANLIIFCVRAHLNGIDTQPDWYEALRREIHYSKLREMMRAAGHQLGKPNLNAAWMMERWLDYLQVVTNGESVHGH